MDLHHLWITINSCKYVNRAFVESWRDRLIFHCTCRSCRRRISIKTGCCWSHSPTMAIRLFSFQSISRQPRQQSLLWICFCPTQAYICMEKGIDRVLISTVEPVSLTTDHVISPSVFFSADFFLKCNIQIVGFFCCYCDNSYILFSLRYNVVHTK